jgi:hypothetical protein
MAGGFVKGVKGREGYLYYDGIQNSGNFALISLAILFFFS